MRKVNKLFIPVILVFTFWSCTEDIMDRVNKNVNDPTNVESKLIISDAMTSTAFSVIGSDLAFYTSVYMEHNTGIWGQMYNAEIRTGDPSASSTYNNNWVTLYNTLYNLKVVIEKCSPGGLEDGNFHTLGIAQVLTALNLATLTDLWGDVPWTEALQPGIIFTPVIDNQENLYTEILDLLDQAIINLDKPSLFPALGVQDFIYGVQGTTVVDEDLAMERWKKFAYGLKARYTMRLSLRAPDYNSVITFADQSFVSAAEQADFNYNGATSQSPFYRFFNDRDYFGASQSLHDKLLARGDPRDTIFWMIHPDASDEDNLAFAANGTPTQVQGLYSVSAITNSTAPTYLLSYHEIEFLKAEAYVRTNQLPLAQVALRAAVVAALQKENIGLAETDAEDYFDNQVLPLFTANPLSEVMNQKYIAFYEEEAIEAYNDYRRLLAMGDNVIDLDNPKNTDQFPLRLSYGSSDVTTNVNVRNAYGNGTYIYSENVWWAGGTR